jgi:hypothetical protein
MAQTDKMPALDPRVRKMVRVLKTGSKATKARVRKTSAPKGRKSPRPSEGLRRQSLATKHLRLPIYKRSLNIGLQS